LLHFLIMWEHPSIISKVIGYGSGAYVAIPNYGLVQKDIVPLRKISRDNLIYFLPLIIFVLVSIYIG
jgi:hypothetical protein